ncbi:MAG: HAD-IA family hydrolase [Cellvibrionales bacterium]|nr:HAD-IA family hydrolase [Cellvibrionales bacterium]
MIKALFFDMDETLCDTSLADAKAKQTLITEIDPFVDGANTAESIACEYIEGIYKRLSKEREAQLYPITDESTFRKKLLALLFDEAGYPQTQDIIDSLQNNFNKNRKGALGFYATLEDALASWKNDYIIGIITNGPEYSQVLKIEAIGLKKYADFILIGGLEKEEKPAVSIFEKALRLAQVSASEAIHFGDKLSTDVLGANQTGIQSVWISHGKDNNEGIVPDVTLDAPLDMIDFIQQLS